MASVAAWLPIARAAAIGWVPVGQGSMPNPPDCVPQSHSDERVLINVSGEQFETWKHTLEKFPDTLLGSSEKEYFYDDVTKEYFFDRDPIIFKYILNYYRTGLLHFPKQECVTSFDQELSFFGIIPDVMGDCCYEDYQVSKII